MDDRDHFAAAALEGFASQLRYGSVFNLTLTANQCYELADAMLRERERTNHDAAPAARTNAESVAPQPTAGDRSGNPTSHSGTGKQPAPPCAETDGFSSGSRSGQINRSPERQSPDRECGESSLRDVPQQDNCRAAGGPELKSPLDVEELLSELHYIAGSGDHVEYDIRRTACEAEHAVDRLRAWVNELQLSTAEIDSLQHVVEDGRIVGMSVYGHLRSLLVRLRPEWESDSPEPIADCDIDRSKPINGERLAALEELSALDQKLELEYGLTGNPMIKAQERTRPTHATQPQGSVQGKGSFRDSRNAIEPVAWLVNGSEYDTGCEYEYATLERGIAEAATAEGCVVVPLYRHPQPTLTDEEREAVRFFSQIDGPHNVPVANRRAATLRKMLERLA